MLSTNAGYRHSKGQCRLGTLSIYYYYVWRIWNVTDYCIHIYIMCVYLEMNFVDLFCHLAIGFNWHSFHCLVSFIHSQTSLDAVFGASYGSHPCRCHCLLGHQPQPGHAEWRRLGIRVVAQGPPWPIPVSAPVLWSAVHVRSSDRTPRICLSLHFCGRRHEGFFIAILMGHSRDDWGIPCETTCTGR